MEVKREEAVDVKSDNFPPSQTEDKSCSNVQIKAEPCEDTHDASDVAQGNMNTQELGCKYPCVSKCKEGGLTLSSEEEGIGDSNSEGLIKQEDCEFGKGVVVMRGEDFVVEVDPNYESGDDPETEVEVKVEYESENGELEMCVDSSGDMPGVPSKRQGSACLSSSGEVAVDVRGRCGSSERSVRSSCGQSCVGAAVSAPSTASSSWEAGVMQWLPDGNESAHVRRNRLSGNGSGVSEDEVCPGCGKEGVPCPVCLDVSGENLEVEGSPKTVHRGKGENFFCSECDKKFDWKSRLMTHLSVVHRGEKKFPCSKCGKVFGVSSNLMRHLSSVHKKEKKFLCSECGKAFGQNGSLMRHLSTVHKKEKKFPCSECGKVFGRNSILMTHLSTVHKKEKKFPCSECGKVFGHNGYLMTHLSTVHRHERKFSCSECGKAFSRNSHLMRHLSTVHKGEKKFPCSECGKAFGQKVFLMTHLSTVHRRERKFSCSECGKAFGQRSHLNVHLTLVHKGKKRLSTSD